MMFKILQGRSFTNRRKYPCDNFTSGTAAFLTALSMSTYSIAVSAQEAPPLPDFKPMEAITIPKSTGNSSLLIPQINPSASTTSTSSYVPIVPSVPTQTNRGTNLPSRNTPTHSNAWYQPVTPVVTKRIESLTNDSQASALGGRTLTTDSFFEKYIEVVLATLRASYQNERVPRIETACGCVATVSIDRNGYLKVLETDERDQSKLWPFVNAAMRGKKFAPIPVQYHAPLVMELNFGWPKPNDGRKYRKHGTWARPIAGTTDIYEVGDLDLDARDEDGTPHALKSLVKSGQQVSKDQFCIETKDAVETFMGAAVSPGKGSPMSGTVISFSTTPKTDINSDAPFLTLRAERSEFDRLLSANEINKDIISKEIKVTDDFAKDFLDTSAIARAWTNRPRTSYRTPEIGISIGVNPDGAFSNTGKPSTTYSSGNDQLDEYAIKCVTASAPFYLKVPTYPTSGQTGIILDAETGVVKTGFVKSPDFNEYMATIQKMLKSNWFPPKGDETKRVRITFKVDSEGRISNVTIVEAPDDELTKEAALSAVKAAGKLPPLPLGSDSLVKIEFTFDYNVYKKGTSQTSKFSRF